MVTPALCAPSELGSRRYSRSGPPYPFTYPDRRFHLSSQDNRAIIMTDRDESDQPRKRIAVATSTASAFALAVIPLPQTDSGTASKCGRCRKRKIRCSGDPGNGGPCSNCKNAGHEPCLFLRVSSQETHMKDGGDYTYNLDAARTYAHQTRGTVSPLSSLPQYTHDIATGGGLAPYRQSTYSYSGKGYHPTMPGWASTYPDDGSVDYGLGYSSSYSIMNQESAPLVSGYSHQYSTRKSDYVDPETSPYSYNNLVHRPAVSNEGFSLSSIAASLPNTSERLLSSDRLHSSVNRTLTSPSSHRNDGMSTYPYTNNSSSGSTLSDVSYSSIQPPFVGIYNPNNTNAVSPAIAHRPSGNPDASTYPPGAATASEQLYPSSDQPIRSTEDGNSGLSYVYSDNKLSSSQRDSHSSSNANTGLLSNGHLYVPESHAASAATHPYMVPGVSIPSAQGRGLSGTRTSVGHGEASSVAVSVSRANRASGSGSISGSGSGSGSSTTSSTTSGSSHRPSDSHRRSAGSLRGI
ncbi:hypothetical protein GGS21DRAFT_548089 [Xylaria nigripes]|nr:hypothetical protein GGS21DRAFT_548089 [Xylaria nigripes]